MSIVRRDPFDDFGTLRRSMDRLFDQVFTNGHLGRETTPPVARRWEPAVEMFETDATVVVRAALPNIDPKQVGVTVTHDTITLQGKTKDEEERKERNYYRRELRYGEFSRTLPLAAEVESAESRATYKDGVLEVTMPKSERVKRTSVEVQVGS